MSYGKKSNRHRLPVPPHIYKWLVNRHGYKDCMVCTSYLVAGVTTNRAMVADYFRNGAGWPEIAVVGYYPSRLKLYSLAKVLESFFHAELIAHTSTAVRLGHPAMHAIREFLAKCRIEEDEFQLATAYKRWQRQGRQALPGFRIE